MSVDRVDWKIILSFGLNLLFFMVAIWFVSKRGGIPYILEKLTFSQPPVRRNEWATTYYQHRTSLFESLPNSKGEIIFLGDSLTDSAEWRELLGNSRIINRGIIGDTTAGVLARMEEIVASQPEKIFLTIGINDLSQGKPIAIVTDNYRKILEIIKSEAPQTQVYMGSVLPVNERLFGRVKNKNIVELNAILKNLAHEFSYSYIDIFSQLLDDRQQLDRDYTLDGLHINGKAYLIWKEALEGYVNK